MTILKSIAKKQQDTVRQIWLASIGAYARGFDEISNFSSKGRDFFNELTEQGQKFETEAKDTLKKNTTETREKLETELDRQVARFTSNTSVQIEEINTKLDKLTNAVEAMAAPKAKAVKKIVAKKAS